MRYCSPTPTWRADTRQASGKPQRNQVPEQLCDIRRSPARLFSCSLPCHLLEYVCSSNTTVLERKRERDSNTSSAPARTCRAVSRPSVTTTTNNSPPSLPAPAPRHQARDQPDQAAKSGSRSVCTQSSSGQDIFPTRLTGLVRLSAHAGLDWTKASSALFPTAVFALPPDSAAAAAYTRGSVQTPSLTLLRSAIPRTAPVPSSRGLALTHALLLAWLGHFLGPVAIWLPKAGPITTAPCSPTSPASSTTSGLSSACLFSRPYTTHPITTPLDTRILTHSVAASHPPHLPTCHHCARFPPPCLATSPGSGLCLETVSTAMSS